VTVAKLKYYLFTSNAQFALPITLGVKNVIYKKIMFILLLGYCPCNKKKKWKKLK
jgi:hypothetical protein